MNKSSIVLSTVMLFCTIAFSSPEGQSDSNTGEAPQYKNYFGFAAGFTTGYGISYRRVLTDKWRLQINFAPFYKTTKNRDNVNYWDYPEYISPDGLNSTSIDSGTFNSGTVSLGLTGLRTVVEGRFFRALLYTGLNVLSHYENSTYYYTTRVYDPSRYIYTPESQGKGFIYELNTKITLGGGGGFEVYAWRFSFNLMAGLRGGINFPDRTPEIVPSIEGGIHIMY